MTGREGNEGHPGLPRCLALGDRAVRSFAKRSSCAGDPPVQTATIAPSWITTSNTFPGGPAKPMR